MNPTRDMAQLFFDYAALNAETRSYVEDRTEKIHNLARMTAAGIVQIGQYLTEVKDRLPHGKFLEWIEREFAWKADTARNFMHVFEHFKNRNFRDLQIDVSALYLIAAPSIPEPVRAHVIQRAENGEHVNHIGVRALVKRFADTGELPTLEVSLPKLIEERRRLMNPEPEPIPREEKKRLEQEAAERKVNSGRVASFMNVIRSVEWLNTTPLTIPEIAAEIDQWDTPDQDWHGQIRKASMMLERLLKELR